MKIIKTYILPNSEVSVTVDSFSEGRSTRYIVDNYVTGKFSTYELKTTALQVAEANHNRNIRTV